MGGGILQLVAKGADDIFLVGDAQITFFKIVYRRHTNFSKTQIDVNFPNRMDFDLIGRCRLPHLADLVNRLYLMIDLPQVDLYYKPFTYKLLSDILAEVEINVPELYKKETGNDIPYNDLVDKSFYDNYIGQTVNTTIQQYQQIITFAEKQIIELNKLEQHELLSSNKNKYLNPALPIPPPPSPPSSTYISLSFLYEIYQDLICTQAQTDTNYVAICSLYNYLMDLYNKIDADNITIYTLDDIKEKIYNGIIAYKYNHKIYTFTVSYTMPGFDYYSIPDICATGPFQLDYTGFNRQLIDTLNINDSKIIVLNYQKTQPIQSFFLNLIDNISIDKNILVNLDVYLIMNLYLNDVAKTNPFVSSQNNIINVKNDLITVIKSAISNLDQFNTLMKFINNFAFPSTFMLYGIFYPSTSSSSTVSLFTYPSDTNVFFVDNNFATRKSGFYYQNFVKDTVASFFVDVVNTYQGQIQTQTGLENIFIPYFSDTNYTSYLNIVDLVPDPTQSHLSDIFSSITFSAFVNPSLNQKIKLLEFVPFVITQNLITILGQNPIYSIWPSVVWASNQLNSGTKYLLYLKTLYDGTAPVNTRFSNIETYIFNKVQSYIGGTSKIVTHLFTPQMMYGKNANPYHYPSPTDSLLSLLTSNITNPPSGSAGINNLNFLEIIYGGAGTSTNGLPLYLFPLDYMLIWIGYDIMIDIDNLVGYNTPPTLKTDYKISIMKILSLYVLDINRFPTHDVAVMDITYLGTLKIPQSSPNNSSNFVLTATTPVNVNYLLRLSSIWNYISRTQMDLFNGMFINSLLSTKYYRVDTYIPVQSNNVITYIPSKGIGQTIGIGYTLRQTFEYFINYFVSWNIAETTPPPTNCPLLLEPDYTPDKYANFYVYIPLLQNKEYDGLTGSTFYGPAFDEIISGITLSVNQGYNGNYTGFDIYFGLTAPYINFHDINLDKRTFNYNSIFNIMNQQMESLTVRSNLGNFLFTIGYIQRFYLNNLIFDGNPLSVLDGYISTLIKIYGLGAPEFNEILGNVYNDLNILNVGSIICPPLQPNDIIGQTYQTMFNTFPVNTPIIRGVLDIFMQIKQDIITNVPSPDVLTYYNRILNYFQILTADTASGPALDYFTRWTDPGYCNDPIQVEQKYNQFISPQPTNVTGNLFYDISYPQPNPNPNYFTNSDIINKYGGFKSVYGIIQFLLDMIIYDVNQLNPLLKPILQPIINGNFKSTNQIINYYNDVITKYSAFLKVMVGSDTITWNDSILYKRLTPLRSTLDGNPDSQKAEFAWSNYIAINLIDYISISIGGQLIEKQYGSWIGLNAMMNRKFNLNKSNITMLGQIPALTTYSKDTKPKYLLYLYLDFWFSRFFNTSLPLICMRYTDVDIHVKFKKLEEVAYWRKLDTYFKKTPKLRAKIMADYVYLEYDERNAFVNTKHEYLINTVQRQGLIKATYKDLRQKMSLDPDELEQNIYSIPLLFSNMCKELVWIFRFEKVKNVTEEDIRYKVLNWDDFTFQSPPKYVKEFQILFNGVFREYWKKASYYNLVQPYSHYYSSFNKNVFMYSFSLYPEMLQPSGAVNLDKLTDLRIQANISPEIAALMKSGDYVLTWDVYCKSSNILRVMSGMAGMAFYGSYN